MAVPACGGPQIPFRGGRIDATSAGPAGVPEPQQDLASHTASFARQGFSPTEMIGLIACGHTVGGVHQVDFPDILDNDTVTSTFDPTFHNFDNTM
jgi:catalase (peroxidase I)